MLICSSKGDFEINDGLIAPGGMGLGVVELVDVRRMSKPDLDVAFLPDEWHDNALKGYAWVMRKLYEIIPVPVKGRLNLFEVELELKPLSPEYTDHCVYLNAMKKRAT